jgi:hypothetical protein
MLLSPHIFPPHIFRGKTRPLTSQGSNLRLRAHAASPLDTEARNPQAVPKDPFAEKTQYKDNFFDRLFIKIYTNKIASQLNGERCDWL